MSKTHHCMVDGIGSVEYAGLLLDGGPEAPPTLRTDGPDRGEHAAGGALHVPGALLHGARAGLDAVLHPREASRRGLALLELLLRNEVVPAPSTCLNRPIGKGRRYAVVEFPLADVKRIKRALGGTVNDVVLAAATGGLRALLVRRGEALPQAGLRAMVPVNVRVAAEHLALGNRVSSLFVHLPVAEENPILRYAKVRDDAEGLKAGDQALAGSTIVRLVGVAPPVLHAFLARSLFATRLFNVTVTNVPGPQTTLYAFGSALRRVHGLVPLAAAHGVGIAVVSYEGRISFGINADRDSVPDVAVIAEGIRGSLHELHELAGAAVRSAQRDRTL